MEPEMDDCESPIERLFAWNIAKYLHEDVTTEQQVEVQTICGTYRLDFLIQRGRKVVAVECDGKEFHRIERDEWRDALILETKKVHAIYRLRGSDLTYHTEDLLYLMSKRDRDLFSERGLFNLSRLASEQAIESERIGANDLVYTKRGNAQSLVVRRSLPRQGEESELLDHITAVRVGLAKGMRTLDLIMAKVK